MNVSINTSWFRSKTPTEPSCRQSRPDRSSSASRGCVHVHVPAYRWVNFTSFAKACQGKILLLELLAIPGAARGTRVLHFDQKIRSVPHFLKPPAIDNEPDSNVKMYVNQRAWRDGANLKAHIASQSEIPVRGRYFFERSFQPLSVEDFAETNRNQLAGSPRAQFRQKLKLDKYSAITTKRKMATPRMKKSFWYANLVKMRKKAVHHKL